MKVLIVCLSIIFVVQSKDEKNENDKCVLVRDKLHKKEVLSNGLNRPYQLSSYGDNVFFSFNVADDDKDLFQIGYIKKEQKEPVLINSTTNGFATAIDIEDEIVYFGGSNGIYVYDLAKPGDVQHVIEGHDVWDMFFKHHLYFIEYPSQRLYKKEGSKSEIIDHIHEKIYQFAIDGNEDTFIVTKDGLHEIKNGTNERIAYGRPKIFRAIEVNRKGVAYFCGQNAIYVANKKDHKLEEIAHIKNLFGLTFDHDDNIIYSDPHQIVKLLPEDCK